MIKLFKTEPKSLVEIEDTIYKIDGVSGRVVNMDLTLDEKMEFTIYLEFHRKLEDDTFQAIPRSGMNANREDFNKGVAAVVPEGTPEEAINGKVNSIMKAMVAGSPEEKWAAFNAIMSGYGAALLPLDEQVEPTIEEVV